jgi:putative glutathione S-transferase
MASQIATDHDTATTGVEEHADDGTFRRRDTDFRELVERGEAGRYHLYVSYACPWAHRTIVYRVLKGLEQAVSMTVVDPERDARGWAITDGPGTTPDDVNGFTFLAEAYEASRPGFDGRVTVPVLWDRHEGRIVNNESAEIIRIFDHAFDDVAKHPERRFCPDELRAEIDELNAFVYENVNDGVYRCGFARRQAPYEHAFERLFAALDALDERLATRRYLLGARVTEADWRLFTTLVRFDAVYYSHFKCNLRRIVDYPNLWPYLRDLYATPGIAATVEMDHIKRHYYRTHRSLNPSGIVPVGPELQLGLPHGREALGA